MAGDLEPRFEAELRRGVIQLLALHFLAVPRYGYEVVRLMGKAGFAVEEGTLYPILRRFEKQGVLSSRWVTEEVRPRKYYELSEKGLRAKQAMLEAWHHARDATDGALKLPMKEAVDPTEGATGSVERP